MEREHEEEVREGGGEKERKRKGERKIRNFYFRGPSREFLFSSVPGIASSRHFTRIVTSSVCDFLSLLSRNGKNFWNLP
mgnify:CR=1 FL=1